MIGVFQAKEQRLANQARMIQLDGWLQGFPNTMSSSLVGGGLSPPVRGDFEQVMRGDR